MSVHVTNKKNSLCVIGGMQRITLSHFIMMLSYYSRKSSNKEFLSPDLNMNFLLNERKICKVKNVEIKSKMEIHTDILDATDGKV